MVSVHDSDGLIIGLDDLSGHSKLDDSMILISKVLCVTPGYIG